ncbi:MAG: hypothetical protein V2A73_09165 [Pseudomonadota bacterium]
MAPRREIHGAEKRCDLAKDLLAKGEDVAAESEAKKAIALDPRNEEAAIILGLVYLYRANQNERLVEIDDCLEGSLADDLRERAADNMRNARKQFVRATELAPDFGEAWQNRAVVSMYFRDWDRAIQEGQQALSCSARLESEPLARANLGWAYHQKQDYSRAASELLQSVQRSPFFCLGSYRLAVVLYEKDEYQAAIDRLSPFMSDPRRCPLQEAFYTAGRASLRLHDSERARQTFATCVGMAPKSCQARRCDQALREIGS